MGANISMQAMLLRDFCVCMRTEVSADEFACTCSCNTWPHKLKIAYQCDCYRITARVNPVAGRVSAVTDIGRKQNNAKGAAADGSCESAYHEQVSHTEIQQIEQSKPQTSASKILILVWFCRKKNVLLINTLLHNCPNNVFLILIVNIHNKLKLEFRRDYQNYKWKWLTFLYKYSFIINVNKNQNSNMLLM